MGPNAPLHSVFFFRFLFLFFDFFSQTNLEIIVNVSFHVLTKFNFIVL